MERIARYNKRSYQKGARYKWQRRRYWTGKYKLAVGCESCGYNLHDVALDFDHIVPEDKCFSIGQGLTKRTLKEIVTEIRKCRVLCANCHRIKSYREGRNEFAE